MQPLHLSWVHSTDRCSSRCDGFADSDGEPRDDAPAGSDSTEPAVIRDQCNLCSELAGDVDTLEEWLCNQSHNDHHHSVAGPLNKERSRLHYLVNKYTQELNQQKSQVKLRHSQCRLFEVFCGENSQLTNQCLKLHAHAIRFGKTQGDLQTVEGRCKLFSMLHTEDPDNIWFSPTCGPWSAWSQFNGQR